MPPDREDAASLHDMVRAGEIVVRYTSGKSFTDYENEEMLRDAVERRIEIIGEAARRVSSAFQNAHPEVPWRKIIATRHVIAHDYDEINHSVVWRIATSYVPEMIQLVKPLVPPNPPDPEPDFT